MPLIAIENHPSSFDVAAAAAFALVLFFILKSRGSATVYLRGPPNPSFIFGYYRYLNEVEDPGAVYDEWVKEYGPAYIVPGGFGSKSVVICDPRANAHFYSKETFGYVQTKIARVFIENLVS